MDGKYLLVQAIALLYWESKPDNTLPSSKDVILRLLDTIKIPENLVDTDLGRDNLINLKYMTEEFIDTKEEIQYRILKQRLRIAIRDDDDLYAGALEGIEDGEDVPQRCIGFTNNILRHFEELEFLAKMRKFMQESLYSGKNINPRKLARSFITEIEPFAISDNGLGTGRENPLVVKGGNFGDVEMLSRQFEEAVAQVNQEGLMRTGYKAVNRMLHIGGLIRGDTYVVGARRGMNKTGMTLDITLDVPHYNQPYMLDPDKKPLILHITKENSYDQNLRYIAERCYYFKYKKIPKLDEISPQVAAELIAEYTGRNGYHFESIWVPGGSATIMDLQQIVLEYEAKGYEIHLLTIDYLALVDKAGLESHTAGAEIRDAFRRMRNFCNPRKITLLTPHQISSEATNLVRQGETNFVEKVAGLDYWDGSKRLTQEIDVEIVINVERIKKPEGVVSYQTMCIGKNRAVKNMPESHKSAAMQFNEWGLIPDVDSEEDNYFKNISEIRQSMSSDGSEEDW